MKKFRKINWLISAGKLVHEVDFDYNWIFQLSLRWDIFKYHMVIPYLLTDIQMYNDETIWHYSVECGARIVQGLNLMLFYNYSYRSKNDLPNGIDYHQHQIVQ